MEHKIRSGHGAALMTVILWGTTFISTKVLLVDFQPVEILFFRFIIGFAALFLISPRRLKVKEKKQEITFMLAGLTGICLYYLLENMALTYTLASNVGVIISAAPFFTAILTQLFMKQEEKLGIHFFIGFVVAMAGICLISFNGSALKINPLGDLLALLAAFLWSCYSLLSKKIGGYGYQTILTTRRVFGYGLMFMIPALFFFDFTLDLTRFKNPVYLLILYSLVWGLQHFALLPGIMQ
jgi:drug/metabolite transporter (DMT)-like permease